MRLLAKLLLLVGIAVGAEWGMNRYRDEIDEAWFVARIICSGHALDACPSPEMVDAAGQMIQRQMERNDALSDRESASTKNSRRTIGLGHCPSGGRASGAGRQ